MTPDHEAARCRAEEDMFFGPDTNNGNFARAYLDLLAREQRAVEFLRKAAPDRRDPLIGDEIRAFLAERGEI